MPGEVTTGYPTWRAFVGILVSVLLLSGGAVGWAIAQRADRAGVAAIRSRQEQMIHRLDRIEAKLDRIIMKGK